MIEVKLNKKILRSIFNYFNDEKNILKDIKMLSNNNKTVCFDTMLYKNPVVYLIIDKTDELKLIYNDVELSIVKITIITDKKELIDVKTFKHYFIEEIINYIAGVNGFEWHYA